VCAIRISKFQADDQIEGELLKLLPQWETEAKRPFLIRGERVVDVIQDAIEAKEAAKEAKKVCACLELINDISSLKARPTRIRTDQDGKSYTCTRHQTSCDRYDAKAPRTRSDATSRWFETPKGRAPISP
jgi:hypothetical protein